MSLDPVVAWWWSWMAGILWQGGLVVLSIALIDRIGRRRLWPQVLGALWLLAALKLVLPPTLASPASLTAAVGTPPARVVAALAEPPAPAHPSPAPSIVRTPLGGVIVSPPEPHPSPRSLAFRVRDALFLVWLVGTLVLGFRTWRQRKTFVDRARRLDDGVPPATAALLDRCCRQVGLRARPDLRITSIVDTPAVCGARHPVILLPPDAASGADLEAALLHELIHLRHRDPWIEAGLCLLQVVYWPLPFVPLLRQRVLAWREVACDAAVARLLDAGGRAATYRAALASQVRRLVSRPRPQPLPLGMGGQAATLALRLDWLDRSSWQANGRRRLLAAVIGLAMLTCVLPMASWESPPAAPRADATTAGPGCLHLHYGALARQAERTRERPSNPLPPENPSR